MKISVLVPSRERPALLARSLSSLGEGNIEVLVRVDEDDPSLDEYEEFPNLIVGPRHGYGWLHDYYNELAARASGDWLMLWNDDCIMETPGWVEAVRPYDGKLAVLNPNTNHRNWERGRNIFPIFPAKMFELLGHISLSVHNDSWIRVVGQNAGIMVRIPVMVHHDRADLTGNNDDAVYAERQYDPAHFYSERMVRARERDVAAVREYLTRNSRARLPGWGERMATQ
jgi:glycosyltransferase involved in cell wall biosynthesis